MANEAITRRLKIYVNGEEVDATITNLRKNLAKFRALSNKAVEGTPEWKKYNTEVAKTELELKEATTAQKEFKDATKLTEKGLDASSKKLSDFTGHLTQMFQGAKRGDFLQFHEGFKGVTSGIKSATKAGLAFIATPIGAAIAILAGIGLAAKEWLDYNEAIKESIILTEAITKLQGEQADQARLRAGNIKETFGSDFQTTLETARNLVKTFGITYTEAFDVIEDGLVKGADKNEEYFDSLKEYPGFFAQAGFSAQEFKDIISTGYDLGIYKDKLPDAIKEFDISIREQTKSTRDALVNAFGEPFSNDLLQRVKLGQTTTKQALEEIAVESKKTGLNLQQDAQLTADLFRGAGEDALGAVNILKAVGKAAAEANRPLTALETSIKEVADANLELAQAQDEALKSDNYISLSRDLNVFWTKTKTLFFNGLASITNVFTNVSDFTTSFFGSIIQTAQQLPRILSSGVKEVATNVLNTIKTFGGLGDVVTKLLSLDFSGAKQAASDFQTNFSKSFEGVKNSAKDTVQEILQTQQKIQASLFLGKIDNRKAAGEADKLEASPVENIPVNPGTSNEELTDEDKKKLASKKKLTELIKQFEEEQKIQEELKKLEKEQRAEEEDVLRLENKFAKLIAEAEGEQEIINSLEEAKAFQLQEIRDKHADARLKKQADVDKKFLDQDKAFKDKLLAAEENLQQAKNRAYQFGLSTLSSIFGKETEIGKALFLFQKGKAVADIIQNTSRNIALAKAQEAAIPAVLPPGVPNPMKAISVATTTANIASAKINSAIQIGSILSSTIKGFEQGGETFGGNNIGGLDGRGGRLSILHPEEYVIPKFVRQDPEVPRIIEYLEAKRTGGLQSFENGGNVSENPQNITTNTDNHQVIAVINRLNNILDLGLKINYTLTDETNRRKLATKLDETLNASNN